MNRFNKSWLGLGTIAAALALALASSGCAMDSQSSDGEETGVSPKVNDIVSGDIGSEKPGQSQNTATGAKDPRAIEAQSRQNPQPQPWRTANPGENPQPQPWNPDPPDPNNGNKR